MTGLTYNEIEKILNDAELYGEINQPLFKNEAMANAVYDITIIAGDWKHDHAYLEYVMRHNGYFQTREELIYDEYTEDGDDCYSATHRFVAKEYYELFNGKIAE